LIEVGSLLKHGDLHLVVTLPSFQLLSKAIFRSQSLTHNGNDGVTRCQRALDKQQEVAC
jgi:hypothetical protein